MKRNCSMFSLNIQPTLSVDQRRQTKYIVIQIQLLLKPKPKKVSQFTTFTSDKHDNLKQHLFYKEIAQNKI